MIYVSKNELDNFRKKIDVIDKKMAQLFAQRMNIVKDISLYKKTRGIAISDKTRENEVIKRNIDFIDDNEIKEYYVNFISSVLKISKDFQIRDTQGLKVAYAEMNNSLSFLAAQKAFPNATLLPYTNENCAYYAVESGECDCAALPIDDTQGCRINDIMELIFLRDLYINAVVEIDYVKTESNGNRLQSPARFAVFSRIQNYPSKYDPNKDKHFILVFTTKDESGTLAQALNILSAHNFNIHTISSYPLQSPTWKVFFYLEVDGNIATEEGQEMLQELAAVSTKLKLIGTYE